LSRRRLCILLIPYLCLYSGPLIHSTCIKNIWFGNTMVPSFSLRPKPIKWCSFPNTMLANAMAKFWK
jgi:hypothetical protein